MPEVTVNTQSSMSMNNMTTDMM